MPLCAARRCSCALTSSTLDVDGSGTPDDPWVIEQSDPVGAGNVVLRYGSMAAANADLGGSQAAGTTIFLSDSDTFWEWTGSVWAPKGGQSWRGQGSGPDGMTSGTYTALTFTNLSDTVGGTSDGGADWHSTSSNPERITVPVAGRYLLDCSLEFTTTGGWSATNDIALGISISGAGVAQWHYNTRAVDSDLGGGLGPIIHLSRVVQLSAGQYVRFMGYQNTGSGRDVQSVDANVVYLGPA